MISNNVVARTIEMADIYANEAKYNDNLLNSEYYEAVSDVLNWVLNGKSDIFFDYENELFAN